MKKLLAIMMALVMCCSLVVSASAESIDTDYFYIDVDLEGTWTETSDWEAEFNTEIASLYIYVADESEVGGDLEEYYYSQMADAEEAYLDDSETFYFEEGDIDGCPAFCLDYYEDNVTGTVLLILTDNYIYEITIGATEEEYGDLWDAVVNMTVYDVYSGEDYVEEEEEIDDDEDVDVDEDKDEDVDVDDEEIVEEEDEEEEDKKPSKNDKDDEEDEDKKKDKKDKDEDEDEDEKDNTTLIIIIVAGVAVVAIAAVVIVLVTKKK